MSVSVPWVELLRITDGHGYGVPLIVPMVRHHLESDMSASSQEKTVIPWHGFT